MKKILVFLFLNLVCFSGLSQSDITENEIRDHLLFLASEKNAGRYPGTKANRKVVKYLKKDFKKQKLIPFEKGYKQNFKARLRVEKGENEKSLVKTCNVVGYLLLLLG